MQSVLPERDWKARPEKVIALYGKGKLRDRRYPSRAGHVEPGLNPGGPPPKAK